jgi:hypothetical protein
MPPVRRAASAARSHRRHGQDRAGLDSPRQGDAHALPDATDGEIRDPLDAPALLSGTTHGLESQLSPASAGGMMTAVDVIAQRVRTSWSKRSRGFPSAATRNAVPTAFPLPSGQPPLFHDVTMDESDGFTPRMITLHEAPPQTLGLRRVGDSLLVRVPNGFGVPVRAHRPVVTLRSGEWIRWQLNNRHSSAAGMAEWHYTLTTISIAFGPVPTDAFLRDAPHVVDELAVLR